MPPALDIHAAIKENADAIIKNGLWRYRREIESAQGAVIRIENRETVNFCSNDYLGLANHPEIKKAFKTGIDQYGCGSGASQMMCGYTSAHRALEEKIADFTSRQKAVLFSSGYMANLAIVGSLLGKSDVVVEDRLNHASMIDAARLTSATFKRFLHANPESLDEILKKTSGVKKLVMTDGVFSMDGDTAPLDRYIKICSDRNAWLMVDDAHGFGVFGDEGAGTLEMMGLTANDVPILMATFGKALGTFGAFVAGDEDVVEYLIQVSRTLIYTTAMPPALAVATTKSLDLLSEESWRRNKLEELVNYFRRCAQQAGLPLSPSATPIQPFIIGDAKKAVQLSEQLLQKGICVQAIRPPTVPKGTSRLRITLTAAHEKSQIDRLLECLKQFHV